ncbi:hypothetical protein DEM27_22985 [Metarhizobium album]|uniref:Zinc/iron-chelating domain-containing protein n=1 Tax=Metarhizobium album TaxID=2182425 RepID=A0A2U2DKF9_9HYPH|nr:hypothetical protein [Rhizobium album]PWE53795.1 hypothetical protein DEM27_22985 [Rhizobium album]
MIAPHKTITARSCGTCTLCCRLPEIEEFDKPANIPCRHCMPGTGCAIYADRPSGCRDFFCLWMSDPDLPDEWEPAQSNLMICRHGQQMTVLVDPEHPDVWKAEPYASGLNAMAKKAATSGGYVIVFVGDEIVKIPPA